MIQTKRTENFARRLREARKAVHMTQAELAEWCGCEEQTVQSWERGRTSPNVIYLGRICRALGASADRLLGLEVEAP